LIKNLQDTNICIALIRQKSLAVLQRLVSLKPGDVAISSITVETSLMAQKKVQRKMKT